MKGARWYGSVAIGILWATAACVIGFSPLHHWQGWVVCGACIASYEVGRAVRRV